MQQVTGTAGVMVKIQGKGSGVADGVPVAAHPTVLEVAKVVGRCGF